MTMMRWDPFSEFATLRDTMDRVFGSWERPARLLYGSNSGVRPLPIDMYETPERFIVKAHIPGVNPKNVDVTVEQGSLTIKCHIPSDAEKEEDMGYNWLYREMGYGEYARTISLPALVDKDNVEATFEFGILTIHIPKTAEAQPRQIKVKVASL